jgi:hypothetical protein
MEKPLKSANDVYNESEAAAELKISIERLHSLLDRKVFNQGTFRPASLNFQPSDLLLLRFWLDQEPPKLIQMPGRRIRRGTGTDNFETQR